MDVKPWEPVTYRWVYAGEQTEDYDAWKWGQFSDPCDRIEGERMAIRVTLANGQRIIVRALSEDRKAARAARKAELAPWIALGQHAAEGLMNELRVKGYCDGDPAFRPSRRAKEASQ